MVEGTVTGKTFNELTPGAATGGFGVRAAAEVPVIDVITARPTRFTTRSSWVPA